MHVLFKMHINGRNVKSCIFLMSINNLVFFSTKTCFTLPAHHEFYFKKGSLNKSIYNLKNQNEYL